MSTLAKKIKELRTNLDMTQKDFSQEISVSVAAYNAYETGKQYPRANVIKRICEKYDVSADWLLGRGELVAINSRADLLRVMSLFIDLGAVVATKDNKTGAKQTTLFISFDGLDMRESILELNNLKNLVKEKTITKNIFALWLESEVQRLKELEATS